MNSVSVATLKQKLSQYLRQVEQGEEVLVTSHRRRVARIVPAGEAELRVEGPTRPATDLALVRGVTAGPGFSAVASLIRERRSR